MTEGFAHVKTGQVTFAVRDTSIDGVEIRKDDFMALAEGKIILSTPQMMDAAKQVIDKLNGRRLQKSLQLFMVKMQQQNKQMNYRASSKKNIQM